MNQALAGSVRWQCDPRQADRSSDIFPYLCGLGGIPILRTVEGYDLSEAWRGVPGVFEQQAVLTMNFGVTYDYRVDGQECGGVRPKRHSYTWWLDGRVEVFDLASDPLQMTNLSGDPAMAEPWGELKRQLRELMDRRSDRLVPCTSCRPWFDHYRRVVRNVHGPPGNPEDRRTGRC